MVLLVLGLVVLMNKICLDEEDTLGSSVLLLPISALFLVLRLPSPPLPSPREGWLALVGVEVSYPPSTFQRSLFGPPLANW